MNRMKIWTSSSFCPVCPSNQGHSVSLQTLTLPVGDDIHTCSDTEAPADRQKHSFSEACDWTVVHICSSIFSKRAAV